MDSSDEPDAGEVIVVGPNGSDGLERLPVRLAEWVGKLVVIDCSHPYVAIGRLVRATADYLELNDADMHDLRDSTTSRENYLVKTAIHGVGATRRQLIFRMEHVVGISPLDEVVTQ